MNIQKLFVRDALNNLSGKNLQDEDTNVRQMNGLLKLYYNTIIDNVRNNVPKIIMYFLIKKIEDEINLNFYEKIMCVTIDELLEEESNISLKRKDLRYERNGEEAWDKELKKREEATLKCKALQRLVKDINRHEDFETRLIYEENINYRNPFDNSVVECGIYFDWSLKNNLKFMNDKIIGKII